MLGWFEQSWLAHIVGTRVARGICLPMRLHFRSRGFGIVHHEADGRGRAEARELPVGWHEIEWSSLQCCMYPVTYMDGLTRFLLCLSMI